MIEQIKINYIFHNMLKIIKKSVSLRNPIVFYSQFYWFPGVRFNRQELLRKQAYGMIIDTQAYILIGAQQAAGTKS